MVKVNYGFLPSVLAGKGQQHRPIGRSCNLVGVSTKADTISKNGQYHTYRVGTPKQLVDAMLGEAADAIAAVILEPFGQFLLTAARVAAWTVGVNKASMSYTC